MILIKTIFANEENIRFTDFALKHFNSYTPSKKGIKKLIKQGAFKLNNETAKTGSWVNIGDKIELFDIKEIPPKTYPLELNIVFEDNHIAVINKPAGIAVSGNNYKTIQNALIGKINIPNSTDKLQWARPVHRLDSATRGLLIVAKTKTALIKFGALLESKKIKKTYIALVIGKTPKTGCINTKIDNQEAFTEYKTIEHIPSLSNEFLSLLEVYPKTGRTHQIRKHLLAINHPIMGDKLYGKIGKHIRGKGLFLCAKELVFLHPITEKQCEIKIPTPKKFISFIANEKKRFEKFSK